MSGNKYQRWKFKEILFQVLPSKQTLSSLLWSCSDEIIRTAMYKIYLSLYLSKFGHVKFCDRMLLKRNKNANTKISGGKSL